ncbi:type I-B CRISPR-associated protein Cas5b [Siphonobacter sp. SORGH_AS_1065]|uniref:type I-B CRISPR-associated protein Cas5b n=1 Tax=Siphonobacter sp. SORGH_AS_1065 TaxID=3041795 RepID=UPI00278134D3|nr:type I-B CRISPR-associated protein Cas5b [Siphonobacter sp. SORGH_AS_1065]MDQ1089908.1 CRISPR-associated protein Cas5h [Siphonobacter sp. SORGH_AS_1065]
MNEQITLDLQPIPEIKPVSLRLISFDLRADFGFFRKPDVNDGLQLSYNMLHKPALLGILGAIAGLKGYAQKGQWPQYYKRLKDVQVGIEPLKPYHEKGNFTKTALKYTNTVGYANKAEDGKSGANQIIHESTLRSPAYRVYVLLNEADELQHRLLTRIKNQEAEFVPYLGKNEFTAWWENVMEYTVEAFRAETDFTISTLFIREYPVTSQRRKPRFSPSARAVTNQATFAYFERLPVGFDEQLLQYELAEFAFTDWTLQARSQVDDLYEISSTDGTKWVIQLF